MQGVRLAHVGRLPDLQGVVFLGILTGLEEDDVAVIEQRESVTGDRRLYVLVDDVVRQEDVIAALTLVEHVQVVFAIGSCDPAFELQVLPTTTFPPEDPSGP